MKNNKFLIVLSKYEGIIGGILMFLITVIAFIQVIFRYVLKLPLAWTEEYIVYLFAWMIYIGASYCTGEKSHLQMEVFYNRLSIKGKKVLDLISDILWLVFTIIMFKSSFTVTKMVYSKGVVTLAAGIPCWIGYLSVTVCMLLMGIHLINNLIEDVMRFKEKGEVEQ